MALAELKFTPELPGIVVCSVPLSTNVGVSVIGALKAGIWIVQPGIKFAPVTTMGTSNIRSPNLGVTSIATGASGWVMKANDVGPAAAVPLGIPLGIGPGCRVEESRRAN